MKELLDGLERLRYNVSYFFLGSSTLILHHQSLWNTQRPQAAITATHAFQHWRKLNSWQGYVRRCWTSFLLVEMNELPRFPPANLFSLSR